MEQQQSENAKLFNFVMYVAVIGGFLVAMIFGYKYIVEALDNLGQFDTFAPEHISFIPHHSNDWAQNIQPHALSMAPNPARFQNTFKCEGGRLVDYKLDCPPGESYSVYHAPVLVKKAGIDYGDRRQEVMFY